MGWTAEWTQLATELVTWKINLRGSHCKEGRDESYEKSWTKSRESKICLEWFQKEKTETTKERK